MREFPSIETVYVRDKATNKLVTGKVRNPEAFEVRHWTVSEKVDGTNIRAIVTLTGIDVRGRTDKAQLPPGTQEAVLSALPKHQALIDYFTAYRGKELPEAWSVTFYGEAYGAGIQKGGQYDSEMRRICAELSIPTMPVLGQYHNMVAWGDRIPGLNRWYDFPPTSREGLDALFPEGSVVAFQDRGVKNVQAEGIVAKPRVVLLDRHGDRVLWKITYRDLPAEAEKDARANAQAVPSTQVTVLNATAQPRPV